MESNNSVRPPPDVTPPSPSIPSVEKKVGFARPTLIIPPPRTSQNNSPRVFLNVPEEGPKRKPSLLMFDHIHQLRDLGLSTAKTSLGAGEKCAYWLYSKVKALSKKWFTHCFLTIVLLIYTVGGALSFKAIEEPVEESVQRIDIWALRQTLIGELTNLSRAMPYDNQTEQWEEEATDKIDSYVGQVIQDQKIKDFIKANNGPKVWTIWNSVVFCATIYTTIGYGHMFPKTNTGRALTIVYALIGIPLFLIALTDFGKLFTRGIKFVWSFIRRLYYTGSCRNARKNSGVDDIFKGAQNLYDYATFKRPSLFDPNTPNLGDPESQHQSTDTPTTPAISNYEIDDEFNLPISVALFILVSYIFCGAVMYMVIEKWNFFEAFYFVFISMSTIGFGDYVPRDQVFMIISIIYLVFGLALMSMCINVVQAKLSDTFKKASSKIGATMGLQVDEEDSVITATPQIIEDVTPVQVETADERSSDK